MCFVIINRVYQESRNSNAIPFEISVECFLLYLELHSMRELKLILQFQTCVYSTAQYRSVCPLDFIAYCSIGLSNPNTSRAPEICTYAVLVVACSGNYFLLLNVLISSSVMTYEVMKHHNNAQINNVGQDLNNSCA